MDALNSTSSRRASPAENMRTLEKAIGAADQRIRMRRTANSNAQIALTLAFGVPFCSYLIYNFFAAGGVMQNYKASSGAYMFYAQNWLIRPRSQTSTYRPEIDLAVQSSPLVQYTKKVEAARKEGTLPEGINHPTSWH